MAGTTLRYHLTNCRILPMLLILLAISASAQKTERYPHYVIHEKAMTIDAKHGDDLGDVALTILDGPLPDTVKDVLRFFAHNGTEYVSQNAVNRWRCLMITEQMLSSGFQTGDDPEQHLRDSLALIYPDVPVFHLDLLHDSIMSFTPLSELTDTMGDVLMYPLRELMTKDRWYFFELSSYGSVDGGFDEWMFWFRLDENGNVQQRHNGKRFYPSSGSTVKNL